MIFKWWSEGVDFAPGGDNSQDCIATDCVISGDPELLFLRLDVDQIAEGHGRSGLHSEWTNVCRERKRKETNRNERKPQNYVLITLIMLPNQTDCHTQFQNTQFCWLSVYLSFFRSSGLPQSIASSVIWSCMLLKSLYERRVARPVPDRVREWFLGSVSIPPSFFSSGIFWLSSYKNTCPLHVLSLLAIFDIVDARAMIVVAVAYHRCILYARGHFGYHWSWCSKEPWLCHLDGVVLHSQASFWHQPAEQPLCLSADPLSRACFSVRNLQFILPLFRLPSPLFEALDGFSHVVC